MSEFKKIKADYYLRSELWEDPDFPAKQTSVFYHQTPPFTFEWKRAKDIYENASFISHNSDVFDVIPGKLGDKWLLSCLGILFLHKDLFYRVVPADQQMDNKYAGIFRFQLWWCGRWVEVLVDDLLPTVNDSLAFLQPASSGQMWAALLEKAYAKLHGSYEALKYGSVVDGFGDLTGGITDSSPITHYKVAALRNLLRTSSIVTAHYYPPSPSEKHRGLEQEMNYMICDLKTVDTIEGPVNLVRLHRPHAHENGVTHVVVDSERWQLIPVRELSLSTTRGFWMIFEDVVRLFPKIEIVYFDADTAMAEATMMQSKKWQVKTYQSAWKKGVTAGGCRNHPDFFHLNPQIQITIQEPESIFISLNQHNVTDPKVMGFSIFKLSTPLTEKASPEFLRKTKSAINSNYANSRQIGQRCTFDPATYLIMPTTYEPREEASFMLRILSVNCIKMTILDDPPQMTKSALIKHPSFNSNHFASYEAYFIRLADEHKTINVFELSELLEYCLPNDYIKSCASIDTCRQIVLTLDTEGSGRISFAAFKDLVCSLKVWQIRFRKHTVEKMGVLRAERFKDALRDVGFVVPERVMSQLILRYMRKDGMLRFGDYVSAIMHLQRAFTVYHANTIRMTLSEWLYSAFN